MKNIKEILLKIDNSIIKDQTSKDIAEEYVKIIRAKFETLEQYSTVEKDKVAAIGDDISYLIGDIEAIDVNYWKIRKLLYDFFWSKDINDFFQSSLVAKYRKLIDDAKEDWDFFKVEEKVKEHEKIVNVLKRAVRENLKNLILFDSFLDIFSDYKGLVKKLTAFHLKKEIDSILPDSNLAIDFFNSITSSYKIIKLSKEIIKKTDENGDEVEVEVEVDWGFAQDNDLNHNKKILEDFLNSLVQNIGEKYIENILDSLNTIEVKDPSSPLAFSEVAKERLSKLQELKKNYTEDNPTSIQQDVWNKKSSKVNEKIDDLLKAISEDLRKNQNLAIERIERYWNDRQNLNNEINNKKISEVLGGEKWKETFNVELKKIFGIGDSLRNLIDNALAKACDDAIKKVDKVWTQYGLLGNKDDVLSTGNAANKGWGEYLKEAITIISGAQQKLDEREKELIGKIISAVWGAVEGIKSPEITAKDDAKASLTDPAATNAENALINGATSQADLANIMTGINKDRNDLKTAKDDAKASLTDPAATNAENALINGATSQADLANIMTGINKDRNDLKDESRFYQDFRAKVNPDIFFHILSSDGQDAIIKKWYDKKNATNGTEAAQAYNNGYQTDEIEVLTNPNGGKYAPDFDVNTNLGLVFNPQQVEKANAITINSISTPLISLMIILNLSTSNHTTKMMIFKAIILRFTIVGYEKDTENSKDLTFEPWSTPGNGALSPIDIRVVLDFTIDLTKTEENNEQKLEELIEKGIISSRQALVQADIDAIETELTKSPQVLASELTNPKHKDFRNELIKGENKENPQIGDRVKYLPYDKTARDKFRDEVIAAITAKRAEKVAGARAQAQTDLQTAITNAKTVNDNANASQTEISQAIQSLEKFAQAANGTVEKYAWDNASDKTANQQLLAELKAKEDLAGTRARVKAEIETLLTENPTITAEQLPTSLWKDENYNSWQDKLDALTDKTAITNFGEAMKSAILAIKEENDNNVALESAKTNALTNDKNGNAWTPTLSTEEIALINGANNLAEVIAAQEQIATDRAKPQEEDGDTPPASNNTQNNDKKWTTGQIVGLGVALLTGSVLVSLLILKLTEKWIGKKDNKE